jgi:hypothetical protein
MKQPYAAVPVQEHESALSSCREHVRPSVSVDVFGDDLNPKSRLIV